MDIGGSLGESDSRLRSDARTARVPEGKFGGNAGDEESSGEGVVVSELYEGSCATASWFLVRQHLRSAPSF